MDFSKKIDGSDFMADKYMSFFVDGQRYAFPIKSVQEIIRTQVIIPVPEFPEYAKGIINVRGNVIPIIDIHLRFHLPETVYQSHTCIIIINYGDRFIGFIVDDVSQVAELPPEKISDSPKITTKGVAFISGVGKDDGGSIIMILDENKLLTREMIDELAEKQEQSGIAGI